MQNYKVQRYKLYKFKELVSEYLRYLFGDTEEVTLWRTKKLQDILAVSKKKK